MMILAALSFSDPLMLAGLAAALVPLLLHLLNRVRAPIVPFPTLRFLKITAQKTARRRQVQQYFLLLVRVVVFMMIAMAVAAPLIRGGAASLAYGLVALLLGSAALLVLGGIWSAAALDQARSRRAGAAPRPEAGARSRTRPAGFYGALAAAAIVAAVCFAGLSTYGLASNRFFSGDKGEFNGRSTALVVILDNSFSMLVREDGRTRLDRAKEMLRQLLTHSVAPSEAAILLTNPADASGGNAQSETLTGDKTRLVGMLDSVQPRGRALPMRERIRTALQVLESSRLPSKMLVVLGDFSRPSFADAEVFSSVKAIDFRKDLQIVLMPVGRPEGAAEAAGGAVAGGAADVGITSLGLAPSSERPAIGASLTFEAGIINNSDAADVRDFVFTVDGEPVENLTARVALGAAGTPAARTTIRIPYRLKERGPHRFGLRLANAQDALPWDDQRELVLDVADQIKVLVIGNEDGANPRARSAAFYLQAALAPFGAGSASAAPASGAAANVIAAIPWSIVPTYRGVGQVRDGAALAGYSAVFVCDVASIPAPLADGLATYVRTGGRLIWILGPSVNPTQYNETLFGATSNSIKRRLLPAPLATPLVSATAAPIEWVDLASGVFANLFDGMEAFRTALVTGRWQLAGDLPPNARALAKLPDNVPLFTVHTPPGGSREGGAIYTLLTSPASAWSNLGSTVLLVPLASRMALGDAEEQRGETSVDTGQPALIHIAALDGAGNAARNISLDVTTPENLIVNARLRDGAAGSAAAGAPPRWAFEQTLTPGIYRWKSSDGRYTGMFAVNPPGDEADLLPAEVEALARESGGESPGAGRPTIVANSPPDLLRQLERRSEGTSLMPGFIAMVLILALIEALMSNRRGGQGPGLVL